MSELCLHRIENHWKAKITGSNELFGKEKLQEALMGYEEALYRAEVLNNHPLECMQAGIPFIQIYIISCNNLANTYVELKQPQKGENILKRVFHYLLHLASKDYLNTDEVQSELKRASLTLTDFIKKNGGHQKQPEALFAPLKEQKSTRNY